MMEEEAGTVKLISAEGFEFVVDKEAAKVSGTICNMLNSSGGFMEKERGEVRFSGRSASTFIGLDNTPREMKLNSQLNLN